MIERLEDGPKHRWGADVPLALAVLLAALGTSIANVALPALSAAFAAPFAAVQGVVVAYLAGMTVFALIAGRLGDRFGLKPMLLLGLVLFALGSGLCALAPGLPQLIAARALQGIGAAFMMTLATALMRETAGTGRVGRAMGLLGTVSAMGTALGPALGGGVLEMGGWRALFLLLVPLGLGTFALAGLALPHPPAARPAAIRAMGSGDGDGEHAVPSVWPNLLANLLVAMVMMGTLVVGPFYLRLGVGLADAAIGLVLAVGPGVSMVTGVPAGRLVDRFGAVPVSRAGLGLLGAGAILLALLPPVAGLWGYVGALLVLTPGYQLFLAANTTGTLAQVPAARRGTVSGLLGLARNLGLIAGAALLGALFAWGAGLGGVDPPSPSAVAGGLRVTFLAAAGLILAALAVTARMR
ncbi:MFS transporter [Aquabacter sp. L1I39]|uniref:MFS transporter n=1 Tax=Aquabacter sp. L1I39 TaxID=2820278 RepID=UPI001ADC6514|nr:MFS transporter [Aquabacter sp. L1I39]QTL03560.1 MFS transporter [Aquabacter sp. L1I39]